MREDHSSRLSRTLDAESAPGEKIDVRETPLGKGVFAAWDFQPGDVILQDWGPTTRERSKYTIQVDHDLHVIPPIPLRYLNHSCEANCGLLIRTGVASMEVHALREIEAGEELTLDYETFEMEFNALTGPCLCRSTTCRGSLIGYKDMPEPLRETYGVYVAEYLREADVPLTITARE